MIKRNVIKGWITSVVGVLTMVITLLLIFTNQIDFVWDGIGGLGIGTVLLMAPQTIEKQFVRLFSVFTSKAKYVDTPSEDSNEGSDKNTRKD